MKQQILKRIEEHEQAIGLLKNDARTIEIIAQHIIDCYKNNKKVIVFGNGGSCADSSHIAGELVGRYYLNRKSLPAIALTDLCAITAIANDFGYELVFEKQIDGLAEKGDIAIGISTSGNSLNVVKGIEKAKSRGAFTIAFTGKDGGKIRNCADIVLHIPSNDTPRIQEGYMLAAHIICELAESALFGNHK